MARQLFLTLGAEKFGPPGTLDKGEQATLAALSSRGLTFPELVLGNGAGLSRDTRISAASLGRLLLTAHGSPFQPEFQASLSIAGLDGTTRKRFLRDPVAGDMHLKTGTLNGVTSIAGFVHSESGADYAVVMVVNGPKATWVVASAPRTPSALGPSALESPRRQSCGVHGWSLPSSNCSGDDA
jgi:D-alanyl-D-alanine carboxypeptidase/D-alanyl-D-alanine-endopeptidase (penicillin-binding protein 4)